MPSLVAFDGINKSASEDSVRVWAEQEEHAKREYIHNVKVMDIYDIKMERHEFDCSTLVSHNNWIQSLLGQTCFLN